MAWTVAVNHKTVWGNMKIHVISCSADAATQNVDTGLQFIYGFAVGAKSLSTGAPKIYMNSGAGGTSLVGYLGCSGFASGDEFFVTVFGR